MIDNPIIGVPLRYQKLEDGRPILYLGEKVRRTIQKAGGYVFSLVPVQDVNYMETRGNEFPKLSLEEKQIINKNLDMCDGLILPGGIKFTPYDRYLLELAIKKEIPVLGICLGMQLMSCYNEEVGMEKNETDIEHYQDNDDSLVHSVKIKKNSKLYKILKKEEIKVNSYHNYHATDNNTYKIVAYSEDGLIEAIEYPTEVFNIGVQWHPEISYDFDLDSRKIIDAFIEAAKLRKKEKIKRKEKVLN